MTSRPRTESYLRRISPISNEEVNRRAGVEGRQALLDAILATPTESAPAPRRRWRRSIIGLGAAVAIGGSTAAGWAVYNHYVPPKKTTLFDCYVGGHGLVDLAGVSGNPVADCAAEWRRETGSKPPKLVAYANPDGRIRVLPAGRKPPAEFHLTRLPAKTRQNLQLIELHHNLNDLVDGLEARCMDTDAAVTKAHQILDQVGLGGWKVKVAKPGPDGTSRCALGGFDPRTRTLTVHTWNPNDRQSPLPAKLAAEIRADSGKCWNVKTAAAHVRADAAAIGLSNANGANMYQIHTTVDPKRKCAEVNENVGGTIFILVRGPASK